MESLILFIADSRTDVKIPNWSRYFYGAANKKGAAFSIDLPDGKRTFARLTDEVVRDFREYSIPTVEISLDDESSLDEVINLFVDINQQGEPVKRFDIVKAMYKGDSLMRGIFGLIAREERRGQDIFYKPKKNEFTDVLKRLQVIENVQSPNSKVDKMWERMLEFAIFARTGEHRNPVSILKEFIIPNRPHQQKLNVAETRKLRSVFQFLSSISKGKGDSRIFSDQTHSYTVITSMLRNDFLGTYSTQALSQKLKKFSKALEGDQRALSQGVKNRLKEYRELSAKQTTHVSRRASRDKLFTEILDLL